MITYSENEKSLKGLKFIDLFCGIGGFHLAMTSLGAECVMASDIDEAVKVSYKQNYGIIPKGDIKRIKLSHIPKHDIICAGFPCQPFSISGSQKGFDDERGKLFFNVVKIAKTHKPKVIFLENVKNFEKHDDGKSLERVKAELEKIGYQVFHKVLCAADFGIPQARKRIYIVAFRKSLKIKEFEFPKEYENFRVLRDIMIQDSENKIDGNYVITRKYELLDDISQTRTKELLRVGKIGLGRQGERIYSIDGVSTTLSTQGGGLGGKTGMYLVNGCVRKLYPRECARLMGFPDTFVLAETQEKNYKQFGNSVVVDVIQLISKNIAECLSKTIKSRKERKKNE